jgi:hypothetical protein
VENHRVVRKNLIWVNGRFARDPNAPPKESSEKPTIEKKRNIEPYSRIFRNGAIRPRKIDGNARPRLDSSHMSSVG